MISSNFLQWSNKTTINRKMNNSYRMTEYLHGHWAIKLLKVTKKKWIKTRCISKIYSAKAANLSILVKKNGHFFHRGAELKRQSWWSNRVITLMLIWWRKSLTWPWLKGVNGDKFSKNRIVEAPYGSSFDIKSWGL